MSQFSDGQLIGFAFAAYVTGFAVVWQVGNSLLNLYDRVNGVEPHHFQR